MSGSDSLKLALFDCDGTLVDSQHAIVRAMHLACAREGIQAPDDRSVRRVVGLPLFDAMAVILPDMTSAEHEHLAEVYRDCFGTMRRNGEVDEPAFPGLHQALDDLEARDWLLGVATGKAMRGLIPTLTTHGIEKRFITLQTADKAPGKPNPGMVLQAMSETGVEPEDTVMIGDTTFDMEMARNAGVAAIGVAWGYHEEEELYESGAKHVIQSYSELTGTILKIMENG